MDIEKLKSLFDEIDENKDGMISKEELRNAYKIKYDIDDDDLIDGIINDIWSEADEDGNGLIDFNEYLAMQSKKQEEREEYDEDHPDEKEEEDEKEED